jgi:hypothetical protein
MELICMILLGAFGIFGGMFIGAGNRSGIVGAVVCGALTGIALNLPFIADGDRLSNAVLFCGALVGAIVINFTADENALKKRFLNQGGLRISFGKYYRIGRD